MNERGDASVEFLGILVVLVIPQADVSPNCVGCEGDGGVVDVRVSVRVPLPFVPAWLGSAGVGVSSSARVPVREVVAHG